MCLIVYKDSAATISDAQIEDFLLRNQDGWGATVQTTSGMKVYRGLEGESLRGMLHKHRSDELALHLRMATHGVIDRANTHPFHVLEDVFLMHNGVVSVNEVDKEKSDTWHLVNLIIKPMAMCSGNPRAFLLSKEFEDILFHLGNGHSNRWLISANGTLKPLRKDAWEEHKGLILSNTYAWSSPSKSLIPGNFSRYFTRWLPEHGGAYTSIPNTDIPDVKEYLDEQANMYQDSGWQSQKSKDDDEAQELFTQVHDGNIETIRDLVYSDPEGAALLIKSLL